MVPTNKVTVALPFSKITVEEPNKELAELAVIVAELAALVEAGAAEPEATQLPPVRLRPGRAAPIIRPQICPRDEPGLSPCSSAVNLGFHLARGGREPDRRRSRLRGTPASGRPAPRRLR